ncbi:MAG: TonB-dependent receptor [Bacteroidia bacterium]
MKNIGLLVIGILSGIFQFTLAQNRAVTGWVFDSETLENLPSSVVYDPETNLYTESNSEGFYQLLTKSGKRTLIVASPGYSSVEIEVEVDGVVLKNVFLKPVGFDEEDNSSAIAALYTSKTSYYRPLPRQINQFKSLFGISDPVKLMQFLPGVSGGIEGLSSSYIRGSNSDQNLFLMNGLPLYGNGHVWGLLSNYNTDVIHSAELYRGVAPARFGNRAGGGVLDIITDAGNAEKWDGAVNIDIATASMKIDGPLDKAGKWTSSLAFRRSYWDLALNSLAPGINELLVGNIHDFNFKLNYKKSSKEHYNFWFYNGRDKYGINLTSSFTDSIGRVSDLELRFGWQWSNTLTGFNYYKQLSRKHFMHLSTGISRYKYARSQDLTSKFGSVGNTQTGEFNFEELNSITDYNAALDLEYLMGARTKLRYGTHWVTHHMRPGELSFTETLNGNIQSDYIYGASNNQAPSEWSSYGELDFHSDNYLSINLGARLWTYLGRENTFVRLEPRLTLNQRIEGDKRVQLGVSMNNQGIHQLSSVTGILPQDVWFPTTGNMKPQQTTQFSAAYIQPLTDGFELSIEGYYKYFNGIMYIQESRDEKLSNGYWEQMITQGTGKSQGLEILITKRTGMLNMIGSYTLSNTERNFEDVNGGIDYPFRWDRRHKLALQLVYQPSYSLTVNMNAVIMTGNPVTVPTGRYFTTDGTMVYDFSAINNYRLPNYQRLDVGFTKEIKPEEHFEYREFYGVQLYNMLGQINPMNAQFRVESNGDLKLIGQSYFTFVPSVFYRIEF